jgi:hypothetical protein
MKRARTGCLVPRLLIRWMGRPRSEETLPRFKTHSYTIADETGFSISHQDPNWSLMAPKGRSSLLEDAIQARLIDERKQDGKVNPIK